MEWMTGSDGTGCLRIKVRMDTAELMDMTIVGLRKWWDISEKLRWTRTARLSHRHKYSVS